MRHPLPLVGAAPHSTTSFLLLLCLTTAVLPVGQEVSSASCYSPLSCGHFLVFCPSTHRARLRAHTGRQLGPIPVIGGLTLQNLRWLLVARCSWFKSKNFTLPFFHFQNATSFQNSAIVQSLDCVFFVRNFCGKKTKGSTFYRRDNVIVIVSSKTR